MNNMIFQFLNWLDCSGQDNRSKGETIHFWGEHYLRFAIAEGLCAVSEPCQAWADRTRALSGVVQLTAKGMRMVDTVNARF